MITDAYLQLSSAQANITSSTVVSSNVIDKTQAPDFRAGQDLFAAFTIDTAFASGTSLTLQVIESASANMGSATVVASTDAIPVAKLTQGARFALKLPPVLGGGHEQRYLAAQYVPSGVFSAGAISCAIVPEVDSGVVLYAGGFIVQ